MKRVRVTWQTEETVEWEAVVEIPDDADPEDYFNGDSDELVQAEESPSPYPVHFQRTIIKVAPVN